MWCLEQAHQFLSAPFIHAIYCGVFHCVIYLLVLELSISINLGGLTERSCTCSVINHESILSKQTEIPKNAEWRILQLVWSFTKIQPPGNFSVTPDENLMSCGTHPLELSLCSPWQEQFSSPLEMPIFIYWVCLFGWSQAKPRDPNQVQCPILMDIGVLL